jgi:hypothetical protein
MFTIMVFTTGLVVGAVLAILTIRLSILSAARNGECWTNLSGLTYDSRSHLVCGV